jgi:hypothetical protein
MTVPFYYPEHEIPFDYFRYTQFGLKHLLESAGFKVIEMEWLEGYWGTIAFQLQLIGKNLPIHPKKVPFFPWNLPFCILMWVFRLQCRLVSPCFSILDRFRKRVDTGHPKNYAVIAMKKDTLHK